MKHGPVQAAIMYLNHVALSDGKQAQIGFAIRRHLLAPDAPQQQQHACDMTTCPPGSVQPHQHDRGMPWSSSEDSCTPQPSELGPLALGLQRRRSQVDVVSDSSMAPTPGTVRQGQRTAGAQARRQQIHNQQEQLDPKGTPEPVSPFCQGGWPAAAAPKCATHYGRAHPPSELKEWLQNDLFSRQSGMLLSPCANLVPYHGRPTAAAASQQAALRTEETRSGAAAFGQHPKQKSSQQRDFGAWGPPPVATPYPGISYCASALPL